EEIPCDQHERPAAAGEDRKQGRCPVPRFQGALAGHRLFGQIAMNRQKSFETQQPALYIVATPIGNLQELTPRARAVLEEVDVIAAEDTRNTQKLLAHFGISTHMI